MNISQDCQKAQKSTNSCTLAFIRYECDICENVFGICNKPLFKVFTLMRDTVILLQCLEV